jgi:Ca-activated chloride channel family protein
MIFHNPEYQALFLLIPALILIYIYARYNFIRYHQNARGEELSFRTFCQSVFSRPDVPGVKSDRKWRVVRFYCVFLALIFLIIALMRPRWGARETETTEFGVDIAITLDISMSMLAKDVAPSRLERVRSELSLLLRLLEGNRFSLVLFAGTAFIQCPLSSDYSAVYEFISSASPGMITLQGTNIEDALEKAERSLESRFKRNRAVLLISDGEAHDGDAFAYARDLYRDRGIYIFTLGVGTHEGSGIRDAEGEKKDNKGNTVITKLDEESLQELARRGGGRYYHIGNERFDTAALVGDISSIEKSGLLMRRPENLIDRYPIFVFTALVFFTLALWISERKPC